MSVNSPSTFIMPYLTDIIIGILDTLCNSNSHNIIKIYKYELSATFNYIY